MPTYACVIQPNASRVGISNSHACFTLLSYVQAVVGFNEARCALAVLAGRPEAGARGKAGAARRARLRDGLNAVSAGRRGDDARRVANPVLPRTIAMR